MLAEVTFFLISSVLLYRTKMDDPGFIEFGSEEELSVGHHSINAFPLVVTSLFHILG